MHKTDKEVPAEETTSLWLKHAKVIGEAIREEARQEELRRNAALGRTYRPRNRPDQEY